MRQLMDNETPHGVSDEWSTIPWRKLERYIFRLQKRIYKAKQRGDTRAVRGLKRMLKRSKAAKTLAVRQVTQDNRGKRTAGILKRCTKSSSNLGFYEETMCCRPDAAPEPIPPGATHRSAPCCIATHRSRVVDPVPQRLWFTGRRSPQDHRCHRILLANPRH